ncbi:hypothetical protein PCANC_14221 [Puccinia coronata f. sp. avenae]|uniref:Uncharacterized protein n=1 Tax=Puccinia coronata f. sp. avenae TaxID=200324 RepID=A0A2N5SYM4_9BASI|nr:hypothetical protein PCANC_14221 [Puccinia coronata f. sp. avenae]
MDSTGENPRASAGHWSSGLTDGSTEPGSHSFYLNTSQLSSLWPNYLTTCQNNFFSSIITSTSPSKAKANAWICSAFTPSYSTTSDLTSSRRAQRNSCPRIYSTPLLTCLP